ncbi:MULTISPECIES: hypothetical protein [unclassified Bradyrhizobium]|uniref:hypothetical protein n=1 Tax=unclassified Bradyrhizobium TaxID=2631580 RepID=UPI0028E463CC|nr:MULTISPECIES: hypothetical protein [unclassified Bradyrhizobium]
MVRLEEFVECGVTDCAVPELMGRGADHERSAFRLQMPPQRPFVAARQGVEDQIEIVDEQHGAAVQAGHFRGELCR